MITLEQSTALRFIELLAQEHDREPGALGKERRRNAIGETQGIQHELEPDLVARHLALFDQRCAALDLLQIPLRLLVANLTQHAFGERNLRMRARPYAQIVAEAPVIEIVPALVSRQREGGGLVVNVTRFGEGVFDRVANVGRCVLVGQ